MAYESKGTATVVSSRGEVSRAELTSAQRAAVTEELSRILADPLFKGSRQCVILLSHLVSSALQGNLEGLKERILGVEVFGRKANYDCSDDPIVRRIAGEIRKRLAQYYQDRNSNQAVKIRLLRGAYSPEFDFSGSDYPDFDESEDSEEFSNTSTLPRVSVPRIEIPHESIPIPRKRHWPVWAGITVLVLAAGLAFYHFRLSRSAQDMFWAPLLDSNGQAAVCIADDPSMADASNEDQAKTIARVIATRKLPVAAMPSNRISAVSLDDAIVATKITAWLERHGKRTNSMGSVQASQHDLRQGPLVLIGGFNNAWSLILLSDLRFSIRIDPATGDEWVADAQNPSNRQWKISAGLPIADYNTDYAVITRFFDRETGNRIVAITSFGPYAEMHAADLITSNGLAQTLPAGIRSKGNLQIVLKTTVVSGYIGPSHVLAVNTW